MKIRFLSAAAIAALIFSSAANAAIISATYTGNLHLDDTGYGLYGGGVYDGLATISFSYDTALLAANGSCSSGPTDAYCSDSTNDGAVSQTLTWGSYSETFSGGGSPYNWSPNMVQFWEGCGGCTDFGIAANNASHTGVIVSWWYNYHLNYSSPSLFSSADVHSVTDNTSYVQGYIGSNFGHPAPGHNDSWDYYYISGLQLVPTEAPEPASIVLFGSGLLGVLAWRKRRAA